MQIITYEMPGAPGVYHAVLLSCAPVVETRRRIPLTLSGKAVVISAGTVYWFHIRSSLKLQDLFLN